MATTYNFGDRFSYPAQNGVGTITAEEAQSLTDQQLEAESPELAEMAAMVRTYSLLSNRRTTLEIFNIITQQADPRIALILSSAKRKEDNMPLFAGIGAVKEIMYADPTRVPAGTGFANRNLFSDGIRRVSTALTASVILGQFSQVKEQAEHSRILEAQALHDLKMIIETYDLSQQRSIQDEENDKREEASSAFYFEPKDLVVPAGKSIRVEWQSPGLSPDWSLVGEFTGTLRSFDIVLGIVDDLNTQTILNPNSTLLAAAELAGPYLVNPAKPNSSQYHTILFYPRKPCPGVTAFSLNIRIQTVLETGQPDLLPQEFKVGYAPFIWGPIGESLNDYPVNGSLIVTRNNKVSTSSGSGEEDSYKPAAVYFRNNPNNYRVIGYEPPSTDQLVYRVQPWQPNLNDSGPVQEEELTVEIPRLLSSDPATQLELDRNRFSQIAVALVNSLAEVSLETRVMGAIIRNDPLIARDPTSVVELVAWSSNNVIVNVVLDILRVPEDIELAIGDRMRATTLFSSNPKSVQVKNPLSGSSSGPVDGILKKEQSYMIKKEKPRLWKTILDEATALEDPLWR